MNLQLNRPREEELIDHILEMVLAPDAPVIKRIVVHQKPDDDCWACIWLAMKFIPLTSGAQIIFVNAGECLKGYENDPSTLHFDTGGGKYDHHSKDRWKIPSASFLARLQPTLRPVRLLVRLSAFQAEEVGFESHTGQLNRRET